MFSKNKARIILALTVVLITVVLASVFGNDMTLQRRYMRGFVILLCVAILELSRRLLNQAEPENQLGERPSKYAAIWYTLPGCAVIAALTAYFMTSPNVAFWLILSLGIIMFISSIRLVLDERG